MIRPEMKRDNGWLLFDAPLPKDAPMLGDLEVVAATLLDLNASLPAGCKYALVGVSDLRVRAEQPESAETDAPARVAAVEAGFATSAHQLNEEEAATPCDREESTDVPSPDIASLCREAGWDFEERPDGALVVDLDVRGAYVPALVEARNSDIAVEATVVEAIPESRACRDALASFLLRANGTFRMARAVIRSAETGNRAVFEARVASDADAVEFGLVLGAVAIAAQHCATEAQILAKDDRIAHAYSSRFRNEETPTPVPPPKAETSARAWA